MKRILSIFIMSLALMTPAWAIDHTPWDKLLQTYVTPHEDGVNRFDYAAVTTADRAALDQYIAYLAAQTPSQKTDVETHSFYINLYNALTVQVILDNWPVSSIREIRNGFFSIGPWAKPRVMVEGEELSLDNIEHDILRPAMNDPRVHYAVNCASWGCPNLASRAYTPEWLDEMLDEAARTFINHKRGVRVDKYGRVHTSSIFKWYIEDFGNSDKGVIAHAQQYAAPELAKALAGKTKIDKHSYDWTINAVGKNEGDW